MIATFHAEVHGHAVLVLELAHLPGKAAPPRPVVVPQAVSEVLTSIVCVCVCLCAYACVRSI